MFYTLQPDLPIILWHNQEVQSNTNSTIITNLSPNDTYTICVLAYSAKGEGPVSQLITVITNEGSKCHVTLLWLNDWLILKCSTFSRKHALSDSIIDGAVLILIKKEKKMACLKELFLCMVTKLTMIMVIACIYHAVKLCSNLEISTINIC